MVMVLTELRSGNLGDKNLGFTYDYTVNDADGDTLTVTEQLNDETIRTINLLLQ